MASPINLYTICIVVLNITSLFVVAAETVDVLCTNSQPTVALSTLPLRQLTGQRVPEGAPVAVDVTPPSPSPSTHSICDVSPRVKPLEDSCALRSQVRVPSRTVYTAYSIDYSLLLSLASLTRNTLFTLLVAITSLECLMFSFAALGPLDTQLLLNRLSFLS